MSKTSKDIEVIGLNTDGGEVWVVFDVHGALYELHDFIMSLHSKDWVVFIGDYVDKGKYSFEVIEYLIKLKTLRKIFLGRGNHEELWVQAIKGLGHLAAFYTLKRPGDPTKKLLKWLDNVLITIEGLGLEGYPKGPTELTEEILGRKLGESEDDAIFVELMESLVTHLINSERLLTDVYMQELREGLITMTVPLQPSPDAAVIQKVEISYDKGSHIARIYNLFDALPLVQVLTGKNPAVAVHAALRITDRELFAKIEKGDLTFTRSEKKFMLWKRVMVGPKVELQGDAELDIPEDRGPDPILGLVGHTPTIVDNVEAVREKTNIVNGDIGAFHYHSLFVLNMTRGYGKFHDPAKIQEAHASQRLIKGASQADVKMKLDAERINAHLKRYWERGLVLDDIQQDGKRRLVLRTAAVPAVTPDVTPALTPEGEPKPERREIKREHKSPPALHVSAMPPLRAAPPHLQLIAPPEKGSESPAPNKEVINLRFKPPGLTSAES